MIVLLNNIRIFKSRMLFMTISLNGTDEMVIGIVFVQINKIK